MAENWLGLDFGSSGARAVVIGRQAEVLAEARLDWGKPDPERLAQDWRETLFELISQIPFNYRADLKAIAIDGTSSTSLLCDAENRPLLPPLLYNDARAEHEVQLLREVAPPDHVTLSATSSLAKLLWLQRQPGTRSARHFTHQANWLAALLHGRPGISDYHNSLKLGYDVEAMRYPDWLLNLPVAPLLPQVLEPGTVIAPVLDAMAKKLGVAKDCEIRAGTTDSIAAFLAAGATLPGQAVTSLGSTLVLKLLSTTRVEAAEYGVYSHKLGKLWLAGGASNAGGAVLRAFFSDEQLRVLSKRIAPATPSGLDYYPLLTKGERFPVNDPALQPRLTPRPADDVAFLHGLLEGLSRIEARGYRLLEQLGATPLLSVLSAGGGATNPAWSAMREKMMGVPVQAAKHGEAAYGAALLAAGGTKLLCFE